MRTRAKRLIHYGITEERGQELLKLATLEENRQAVYEAAEKSNPLLAPYLAKSLREKVGYDRLFGKMFYQPCTRADFYAYRRKTLAILNGMMTGDGDNLVKPSIPTVWDVGQNRDSSVPCLPSSGQKC